jgi:preprotein translocase subunit SecF
MAAPILVHAEKPAVHAANVPPAWNTKIDFIGHMGPILWFCLITTLLSLGCIGWRGFNLGTDFAGGYEIQVHFPQEVSESRVRELLAPIHLDDARVQRFGDVKDHDMLILVRGNTDAFTASQPVAGPQDANAPAVVSTDAFAGKIAQTLRDGLQLDAASGSTEALIRRVDFVGPQVGAKLRNNGIMAVVYSLLIIMLYVAYRFDLFFSPGAIIATLHDIILTLGIFSWLQIEMNLTVVAAILTLIGYSLNDTIVVYDRIREDIVRLRGRELRSLVNTAINETLSRTVLTSGTVFLVVSSLLLLGGPAIRGFSIAMLIGVVVGAYSSIAVASPIYILLRERAAKRA